MTHRPTARHDIYASAHKGLRAFMTHALVRVGRLDAHDAAEVDEVAEEVGALLMLCRHHLEHENRIIHPALQAVAPGSCDDVAAEHVGHVASIEALQALLPSLAGRPGQATAMYRALAHFVAENFEHMQREERVHNAVLWAHLDDDDIRALERRIVESLTPEEQPFAVRWMLPHLTPDERASMLGGMRASGAPREAFDGLLSQLRPHLGGRDWRKLAVALGL